MEETFVTITDDGQVTIPGEMLESVGLTPGDAVTLRVHEGAIRIIGPVSIIERTAGMLKPPPGWTPPTAEEMRRMAEEAIAEDVLRRMENR